MIINSTPPPPRIVTDYEFTFHNGLFTSIPIDPLAGDFVTITPSYMIFNLAERPSTSDPTVKIPAEELTVYIQHVALAQKRTRNYTPPSAEVRDEFQKTLIALSPTIN